MTEPATDSATSPRVDLGTAFDSTLGVLRKVERQDLTKPTPCASWDVRDLINHFVGTAYWFAATVSGDQGLLAPQGHDHTAGDYVAAYEQSIGVTLEAFAADGALERLVKVPFGEFPGAALRGFAATDHFTHGWDLARALGLDTDLAPELAGALLDQARAGIGDSLRGPDTQAPFGVARPAPEGATPADRLAAYLGRDV